MPLAKNQTIRVLIADDHAVVRQGLKQILSKTSNLVVVEEARTGPEVLKKLKTVEVDALVMDIEMPEQTGWDVLLALRKDYPGLPVIILSIYPENPFGLRFLKAGASGYLSKTSAPEQLVEAIRTVTQGGKFLSPNLAEQLVLHLDKDPLAPVHERLSDREFQVFRMIASGKPTKIIADELCISVTTVSSHRARILEKMEIKTNADLTLYASKHGLIS